MPAEAGSTSTAASDDDAPNGDNPAETSTKSQEKKTDTSAAEKLDAIARGQAANKSLNNTNTGGSTGDAPMAPERLLSMPRDEFEIWVEKHPAKAKRLMGG
ncbi:hypothetical protein ACVIJ6_005580 [Bradyrhizobium sp. USDA 4369]